MRLQHGSVIGRGDAAQLVTEPWRLGTSLVVNRPAAAGSAETTGQSRMRAGVGAAVVTGRRGAYWPRNSVIRAA